MEDLLKQLKFTHFTGTLWKHEGIGMISIEDGDNEYSLVRKIYQRGYGECQVVIKSTLGIKE